MKKGSGNVHQTSVRWWSEEIKNLIRERRKAERKCNQNRRNNHNTENSQALIDFRRIRARVRYLIKQVKREKWTQYVDTITVETPPTNVWSKIKKISGKSTYKPITAIMNPRTQIPTNDLREIADLLEKHFEEVCTNSNYDLTFLGCKTQGKKRNRRI
jgi:hypothetical protein